jgi:phosphopantothenoylcysteine decarboxylase/phosphopantothenate--cysteine ligase
MSNLSKINIILGITGGIAAYKAAELCRLLKKSGANIQVVTTPAAEAFITPLTLQAVSGNPVRSALLDPSAEAGMGHIELARWADLVLVAPASADFMARLVHGMANDLLTTLCLATRSPIALAPAMNQAMWHNPITQSNVEKIATYPHLHLWGPAAGEQACGDIGLGRMLEPADLATRVEAWQRTRRSPNTDLNQPILHNKKVVITAGPTREAIDPVRYLSNESSGKMGYALAEAAQAAGASVTLISGPTKLTPPEGVAIVSVTSALEMHSASLQAAAAADIFIGAAAVADFRPKEIATTKIKKGTNDLMQLELIKNPDIIADVARLTPKPLVVGFAAETNNLLEYSKAKLNTKNIDMIIANDISDQRIGFNSDDNSVTIIARGSSNEVPLTLPIGSKLAIAQQIITIIAQSQMTEMGA